MGGFQQLMIRSLILLASFSFTGAGDGGETGTSIWKERKKHSAKTVGAMLQQQWKGAGSCSTGECQVREKEREREREREEASPLLTGWQLVLGI